MSRPDAREWLQTHSHRSSPFVYHAERTSSRPSLPYRLAFSHGSSDVVDVVAEPEISPSASHRMIEYVG